MPTIMELFKGSPQEKQVKTDKETFIEQETTGIRVKSLVELNNPLIYGNEATRIALRSTPLVETMKSNANGGDAGGGLIGTQINKARNFVNDKLGIPKGLIPSTVADKIIELRASKVPDDITTSKLESANSQTPITKDGYGPNGSLVGKFLKQSGGGNPTTIGKQALGSGIGIAKDKLRGALFGEGQSPGQSPGQNKPVSVEYTSNDRTYSDTNKSKKTIKTKEELEVTKLNLALVSPLYGTKRKQTGGVFGKGYNGLGEYAFKRNNSDGTAQGFNSRINYFDSSTPYAGLTPGQKKTGLAKSSLNTKYGLQNGYDSINYLGSEDYDKLDEYGRALNEAGKVIAEDLIPFNIGKLDGKQTLFRSTLTGITENVSPSWSSHKFLGNPFPFYTYSQVERSTSFNLKIYCSSPVELSKNWEKLETLTKMTYPTFTSGNLMNPPIIKFRLGDIYYEKVGFIESLTNTIPDNTTWETNGNMGYLPKFIDVAITIKFIEDKSVIDSIYGYKKSKAAIEAINENNGITEFTNDSVERVGASSTRDRIVSDKAESVNPRGIKITTTTIEKQDTSGINALAKKINKNDKTQIPKESQNNVENPIKSQSSISDSLGGKTPIEAAKETENKKGWTTSQSQAFTRLQVTHPSPIKTEHIPVSKLPAFVKEGVRYTPGSSGEIYIKQSGYSSLYNSDIEVYYEIDQGGSIEDMGFRTAPFTERSDADMAFDKAIDNAIQSNRG